MSFEYFRFSACPLVSLNLLHAVCSTCVVESHKFVDPLVLSVSATEREREGEIYLKLNGVIVRRSQAISFLPF